ncbi:hypothetical protein D3Z52_11225 [Clostridiaceae bacterium]|nr:hypothetical protein [Clostridiaceae bacterium]
MWQGFRARIRMTMLRVALTNIILLFGFSYRSAVRILCGFCPSDQGFPFFKFHFAMDPLALAAFFSLPDGFGMFTY